MIKHETAVPFTDKPEQATELNSILEEYKKLPGALLTVLEKAQEIYGYLPLEVQQAISDSLAIPLAQVASVESFYTFFSDVKYGKYVVRVCNSTPCHINTSAATRRALENVLGIQPGQTTPDGKFTLLTCGCLGICDRSPALMVNDEVFGPVFAKDVSKILAQFN